MKKFWIAFAAAVGATAYLYAQSTLPFEGPVRFVLTLPDHGAYPGQLYVVIDDATDPLFYIWNANDGAFEEIGGDSASLTLEDVTASDDVTVGDALTVSGAAAVTGAATFSGNVTLGSDEDDNVTLNGPVTFEVRSEDFDFVPPIIVESDFTAAVVADTTANLIGPFPQIGWLYYRIEQAFGGTYDATTVFNGGVFLLDDTALVDLVDNDAVEFVVGGPPTTAVFFDEDSTESAYCEISVTLTDISDFSANDFYFGAFLAAAIDDGFAYETADTWAGFSVLDNAGDLAIAAELNAGTHGEDDAGVTLADLGTYVLRVTLSADSVAFSVNGTAVTQANAVLNADDGDEFVCRVGFRSAGTASAGVQVNRIEIGRAQ